MSRGWKWPWDRRTEATTEERRGGTPRAPRRTTGAETSYRLFLDAEGVPVTDYGGEIGVQRSINAVAQRGLVGSGVRLSYAWEGIAEPDRDATAACVRWLLDTLRDEGTMAIWRYPYASYYGTRAGWACAHAQAVALRLLVLEGAAVPLEHALHAFEVQVSDGGLAIGDWYAKFADPSITPPRILNGTLFALDALHAIHEQSGSRQALSLFERGLAAVIPELPRYDLSGWSAYDIFGKPASLKYHGHHVKLLDLLYGYTGEDALATWRDRWAVRLARREARMAGGQGHEERTVTGAET